MSTEGMIEDAWERYENTIYRIAKTIFWEIIRPFCKRRGFVFSAGMGAWWIGPPEQPCWYAEDYPEDEELRAVAKLLNLETPGMPANDLGSLMPSFPKEDL